jgi:hypothetical protein
MNSYRVLDINHANAEKRAAARYEAEQRRLNEAGKAEAVNLLTEKGRSEAARFLGDGASRQLVTPLGALLDNPAVRGVVRDVANMKALHKQRTTTRPEVVSLIK